VELLAPERKTLETFLPGLDAALAEIPMLELERHGSPGPGLYRKHGGAKLLVPQQYAGKGATAIDAIHVHRAIASRSPSLGVAVAMHNFSVATLVEVYLSGSGLEGLLLEAIAIQDRLVASGFSEGTTGRGILQPSMEARRTKAGVVINGNKKPCSLTWSMDLLTASVRVVDESDRTDKLAVVLIPANAAGLTRERYWDNWLLAGAESDRIVLKDVVLEDRLVYPLSDEGNIEGAQISGFLWFEILLSATYLGVASALVQRVIDSGKGASADKTRLGIDIEGAAAALEGIARSMMANPRGEDELARMLFVRYAVQNAIERATALAFELLGGIAFSQSSELSYLFNAAHALGLHPPSRSSMVDELAKFMSGGSYKIT
jgi:alkylation response protein AidB-like acyl-CoA dehydrogenase